MDLSQYLEIFIDETKEHLQTLNDQVLIMEQDPENVDTVNEIFRAAHSLKGMAGTMGFKRMQRLTHDLENVFSEIRNGKMSVTPDIVDIVFKCLDALEGYLTNIQDSADEGTEDNEEIIELLKAILSGGVKQPEIPEDSEEQTEAAKEVSAPAPAEGEDKRKFLQLPLADFEVNAMKEAIGNGLNVYGVTVYIQETCILKAARAFLVFKGIESVGEIIKSEPSVQDIEDEKFDFDFSIFIISEKPAEQVQKVIANVSEIKEVVLEPYTPNESTETVTSVVSDQQETKQETPVTESTKTEDAKTEEEGIRYKEKTGCQPLGACRYRKTG